MFNGWKITNILDVGLCELDTADGHAPKDGSWILGLFYGLPYVVCYDSWEISIDPAVNPNLLAKGEKIRIDGIVFSSCSCALTRASSYGFAGSRKRPATFEFSRVEQLVARKVHNL